MDKRHFAARVGNMEQIAYARRSVISEGKADGIRIIDINNGGGLSCTLLESRCLDIARMEFKGINIGFLAKPGLISPLYCSSIQREFLHYFQGGMLYTCGLDNVGPAYDDAPIHGRLGMTPAERVSSDIDWNKGEINISGRVKQATMFGRNIVFKRNIRIPLFGRELYIDDHLENQGFNDEDIMLLYHLNIGWPVLSENAILEITNGGKVEPRNMETVDDVGSWNKFEIPSDACPEQVFYHAPVCSDDGTAHAMNKEISLGVDISFDPSSLPHLVEWKSMASGDYALGIEPATCLVEGYETEANAGRLLVLKPGVKMDFAIKLKIIEGKKTCKLR